MIFQRFLSTGDNIYYVYTCLHSVEGEVTLDATSTVMEGEDAIGVCLTVSAGTPAATALGCDLDIMLTTMPGKAGMYVIACIILYTCCAWHC